MVYGETVVIFASADKTSPYAVNLLEPPI